MSDKECIYLEEAIKAIYEELDGLEEGDTIGEENLRDALYAVPAAPVIPIDWIESQVDRGKWAELVQRWRESGRRGDMIRVIDLFTVTPTITRMDIIARAEDTHYLHRWIVGEGVDYHILPIHTKRDIEQGRATDINAKINAHGDPVRNQPEMGWGYKAGSIPDEILSAPVTHLGMHCGDGITYEVNIDIELPPITAEALKVTWKGGPT